MRCILVAVALVIGRAAANAQSPASRLDSVARAFADRGDFSGVVLVGRRGRIVYEKAFGEADRELHVHNSISTKFRIGSMTKQFTAALVMRLYEEGKLRLDAPIDTYLPDYPQPQGRKVTLEQLLTHSAGIPDYAQLPGFFEHEVMREHSVPQLLALFDSLPLSFEPGTKWDYSNSNYVILGAIVEKVTGQPFAVAIKERLLKPLGLNETAYDNPYEIVDGRARGYMRDSTRLLNAAFVDPSTVYAAGILRSTAHDVFRWAELIRTGKIFRDTATATLMFSPHIETGMPLGGYGFGVFVGTQQLGAQKVRVIQHGGTIVGFASGFWRMPDDGGVVIVLDNTMSHAVPALTKALSEVLVLSAPRSAPSSGTAPTP